MDLRHRRVAGDGGCAATTGPVAGDGGCAATTGPVELMAGRDARTLQEFVRDLNAALAKLRTDDAARVSPPSPRVPSEHDRIS